MESRGCCESEKSGEEMPSQAKKRPSPAKKMPGGCAPAMPGAASSSGLVAAAVASPSSMAVSLRALGEALPSTSTRLLSIRI